MKEKTAQAFTLVELLVVIAIIGILVAIGLSTFMSAQMRARDAQRKSNISEVKRALELFYSDYGMYPAGDSTGALIGCPFNSVTKTGTTCVWGVSEFNDVDSAGATKTTYMKVLPTDPITGQFYRYRVDADKQKFQLFAVLENVKDVSIITTAYTCGDSAQACNFGVSSANSSPTDTSW